MFDNRIENKVYAKDSMDRFGDDLTELILSFFTLEDKFRLECVSKQWKRYIFGKQFLLMFSNDDDHSMYRVCGNRLSSEESIESVLKKCPNITKVFLYSTVKREVLSMIGQYCPRLKSLTFYTNGVDDLDFAQNYGHKLEELTLFGDEILSYTTDDNQIKQFLKFCPNLKTIKLENNSRIFSEDNQFLPHLERIESIFFIKSEYVKPFKSLTDKYSQSLKTLYISFDDLNAEELKTCVDCICGLNNLQSLKLSIGYVYDSEEPIDESIALIGQKCTKLLELDLTINKSVPISNRFFDVFTHFKAIKKLNIVLWHKKVMNGSVESFKHCKQLIDLDLRFPDLSEEFFIDIKFFLPKLEFLIISLEKELSDSFIDSFQLMKNLEYVFSIYHNKEEKKIHTKNWYFGKHLYEVMSRSEQSNIIRVNDNCGVFSSEEDVSHLDFGLDSD